MYWSLCEFFDISILVALVLCVIWKKKMIKWRFKLNGQEIRKYSLIWLLVSVFWNHWEFKISCTIICEKLSTQNQDLSLFFIYYLMLLFKQCVVKVNHAKNQRLSLWNSISCLICPTFFSYSYGAYGSSYTSSNCEMHLLSNWGLLLVS